MTYSSLVIGLGKIGLMYDFEKERIKPASHCLAYELDERIRLLAAADIQESKKEWLHKINSKCLFYQDYKDMLNGNPQVDIVSLCTPPYQRYDEIKHILQLTNARIIFCEKPIARDIEEAKLILKLVNKKGITIIPNISRRWMGEMVRIREYIKEQRYGTLEKIHARYTRGIFNTGAHLFDIIRWFSSEISSVYVVQQVHTSADLDGDPSYSFLFKVREGQSGYAEAFDDRNYYFFELDLYFDKGKIEIRQSGNRVLYYHVSQHSLFPNFNELSLEETVTDIFNQSSVQSAINNIVDVLEKKSEPNCCLEDACIPLLIADSLNMSFSKQDWQNVEVSI